MNFINRYLVIALEGIFTYIIFFYVPDTNTLLPIKAALLTVLFSSIITTIQEHIKEGRKKYLMINAFIAEIDTVIQFLKRVKKSVDFELSNGSLFPYFGQKPCNCFSYYDSMISKIGVLNNATLCSSLMSGYINAKNCLNILEFLSELAQGENKKYDNLNQEIATNDTIKQKNDLIVNFNKKIREFSTKTLKDNIYNLETLKTDLETINKNFLQYKN